MGPYECDWNSELVLKNGPFLMLSRYCHKHLCLPPFGVFLAPEVLNWTFDLVPLVIESNILTESVSCKAYGHKPESSVQTLRYSSTELFHPYWGPIEGIELEILQMYLGMVDCI